MRNMRHLHLTVPLVCLFMIGCCECRHFVYKLSKYGVDQTDYTIELRDMVHSVSQCAAVCASDFGIAFTHNAKEGTCRTLYYNEILHSVENVNLYLETDNFVCEEDGWINYLTLCYWFSENMLSWDEAESVCESKNSTLAYPTRETENNFLRTYIRLEVKANVWLGGSDRDHEGTWRWSATQEMIEHKESNWVSGQPDNYRRRQNCLRVYSARSYLWDDGFCSDKLQFVCQTSSRRAEIP